MRLNNLAAYRLHIGETLHKRKGLIDQCAFGSRDYFALRPSPDADSIHNHLFVTGLNLSGNRSHRLFKSREWHLVRYNLCRYDIGVVDRRNGREFSAVKHFAERPVTHAPLNLVHRRVYRALVSGRDGLARDLKKSAKVSGAQRHPVRTGSRDRANGNSPDIKLKAVIAAA